MPDRGRDASGRHALCAGLIVPLVAWLVHAGCRDAAQAERQRAPRGSTAVSAPGTNSPAGTGTRTDLSAPRVISLHDVTTEMVVALDGADRLVGMSDPVDLQPHAVRAVAHVAQVHGIESILSVRPTVVLGLQVVRERDPDLVAALERHGIEVFLADPVTVDDVIRLTRNVAVRLGRAENARSLIDHLRSAIPAVAESTARPVPVFVYDCCDPPFTAGGKTVLSDLVERAGGRNIFAGLDADWTHVSWEEVVSRRPRLVVIHSYDYEGQADVGGKRRRLQAVPGLADLPIAVVPLGCSLGGLRSVEGFERLRRAIAEVSP
ncbi:MAG: helical backbone metal receptor [Proteobacteria bacterium]|nr:helical backbone metal receptor [Pseudomonadota bacterium]